MLLVYFVLITFWKHDILQREAKRDQAVLAHILTLLQTDAAAQHNSAENKFVFSDFYTGGEEGDILFLSSPGTDGERKQKKKRILDIGTYSGIDKERAALLASAIADAETGKLVSRTAGTVSPWLPCKNLLVSARPFIRQGQIIGAVAVVRPLEPALRPLREAGKTISVYLLLNLMVLTAVSFFRTAKLVFRPVEQLVQLADQYSSYDPFLFAAESSNAFGKLSGSLNRMLTRIEYDRRSLRETVAALEQANTTLKKQQREMIRAEKLASVGRMAAGLAHEIGNPIGAVQGYLGMLAGSGEQNEENRDFIRRSEDELQRVNNLIRQLLDFSRTAAARTEEFSLHELLQSTVNMVRVQAAFKKIALTTKFTAGHDTVCADRDQLHQVFVNCLLNSADAVNTANRPAGEEGRITVLTEKLHEMPTEYSEGRDLESLHFLCIRISDNGTGIAEDQLPVVFDPFYTTKEPGKGTGLGLSVSRSIIETAGGCIDMKSRAGQGSELFIFLPLAMHRNADE